jgi:hypothetical protein
MACLADQIFKTLFFYFIFFNLCLACNPPQLIGYPIKKKINPILFYFFKSFDFRKEKLPKTRIT